MANFWEDKKVTITGGEGFLGGHLASLLESSSTYSDQNDAARTLM